MKRDFWRIELAGRNRQRAVCCVSKNNVYVVSGLDYITAMIFISANAYPWDLCQHYDAKAEKVRKGKEFLRRQRHRYNIPSRMAIKEAWAMADEFFGPPDRVPESKQ